MIKNKYNSGDFPESFNHFINGGSLITELIPTLSDQVFDLMLDVIR